MASKEKSSWFQRLMSMSIWEKEEPAPSKATSSGKGMAGHRDPTADAAIANVMREEKRKEKDKSGNAKNNKADNRKVNARKGGEENA